MLVGQAEPAEPAVNRVTPVSVVSRVQVAHQEPRGHPDKAAIRDSVVSQDFPVYPERRARVARRVLQGRADILALAGLLGPREHQVRPAFREHPVLPEHPVKVVTAGFLDSVVCQVPPAHQGPPAPREHQGNPAILDSVDSPGHRV